MTVKWHALYVAEHPREELIRGNVARAVAGAALRATAEGPRVAAAGVAALPAAVGRVEHALLGLLGVHIHDNGVSVHVLLQRIRQSSYQGHHCQQQTCSSATLEQYDAASGCESTILAGDVMLDSRGLSNINSTACHSMSGQVTYVLGIAAGVWALQGCLQLVSGAGGDVGDVGARCVAPRLAQPCLHNVSAPRHASNPACSVFHCLCPAHKQHAVTSTLLFHTRDTWPPTCCKQSDRPS